MLDYHELQKQKEYKNLPKSFVIFIAENDVIGDGEKIYHADRIIRETGKTPDDLIHDFFCANPAEMRHKQLVNRVSFLKENKGDVDKMSNIIAEYFKDENCRGDRKSH